MRPWEQPPVVEAVSDRIWVVRDDLLPGGTKTRFLPYLIDGAREVVYGSPFCGGAQLALAEIGRILGVKTTLFYAKRKVLHPRQRAAFIAGAKIVQVPHGYMTNVQSKARAYAAAAGALFLPLGFDVPAATPPLLAAMRSAGSGWDEVWCATGSGMLARHLGLAFPEARIKAVVVGLRSRNEAQAMPPNVDMIDSPLRFEQISKASAPFPICGHYEAKAWEGCSASQAKRILFWNVLGS